MPGHHLVPYSRDLVHIPTLCLLILHLLYPFSMMVEIIFSIHFLTFIVEKNIWTWCIHTWICVARNKRWLCDQWIKMIDDWWLLEDWWLIDWLLLSVNCINFTFKKNCFQRFVLYFLSLSFFASFIFISFFHFFHIYLHMHLKMK